MPVRIHIGAIDDERALGTHEVHQMGAETSSILFAHNAGLTPKIANPKLWQRRHQTTIGGEVRVESRHPPP
jgi:hypothetical protein